MKYIYFDFFFIGNRHVNVVNIFGNVYSKLKRAFYTGEIVGIRQSFREEKKEYAIRINPRSRYACNSTRLQELELDTST